MCTGMNCDGTPLERVYMFNGVPMCGIGASGLTHSQQATRIMELEAMIGRFWGSEAVKRADVAEAQLQELENLLREACEVAGIEFHEAKFAPADLASRISDWSDDLNWIASHPMATDPPELAAQQMRDKARAALGCCAMSEQQEAAKMCDQCGENPAKHPVRVRSASHGWMWMEEDWCEECFDSEESGDLGEEGE